MNSGDVVLMVYGIFIALTLPWIFYGLIRLHSMFEDKVYYGRTGRYVGEGERVEAQPIVRFLYNYFTVLGVFLLSILAGIYYLVYKVILNIDESFESIKNFILDRPYIVVGILIFILAVVGVFYDMYRQKDIKRRVRREQEQHEYQKQQIKEYRREVERERGE